MKRKLIALFSAALLLTGCAVATADLPLPSADDRTTASPGRESEPSVTASTPEIAPTTDIPFTTDPAISADSPTTAVTPEDTDPPVITDAPPTEIPSTGETSQTTVPDLPAQPSDSSDSSDSSESSDIPDTAASASGDPPVTTPHVHSWGSWTVTNAATCTATGTRQHICSACGASESQPIAATGHSFGAWKTVKAATCTAAGSREHSCSACGAVESQTVAATGHSFGAWKTVKAATCTAAGSREHSCSVCGAVESQTVAATGHQWSGWTVTKEATIHEEGEKCRTCTSCQAKETQTIPVYVPTEAEKKAMALEVAQAIADSIDPGSDIERVSEAAWIVSQYCANCVYTTEGKDYRQAYGVFIKGEYSCAGSTRALGMVLECMGYKWTHANENQWSHQWCILEMDGQIGFADGQVGWVGYGSHPYEGW